MRNLVSIAFVITIGLFVFDAKAQTVAKDQGKQGAAPPAPAPEVSKAANPKLAGLKGRRVMITEEAAEIRTRESGVVYRAYLGEILTVARVQGEWLWMFETQGWLNSKYVVPHETSIFEMNARIKQSRRAENYALRGVAYMNHRRYKDAIKDFNEVIRRNPGDAGVYVNRGNVYREMERPRDAINDYSKAIRMDPQHFLAMNNRAMIYMSLKKYELALQDLNTAIKLNNEYSEAFENRGIVLQLLGRHEEAIREFTAAIKYYPRMVTSHLRRADSEARLSNYEEALQDLSRAVLLAPADPEVLNDFAWFLATCKEKKYRDGKKAVSMAREATELSNSREWRILDTYAAANAEVGKFHQAERWAEKALAIAPEEEQPRLRRHLIGFKRRQAIRER